jgi:hypothetical protein
MTIDGLEHTILIIVFAFAFFLYLSRNWKWFGSTKKVKYVLFFIVWLTVVFLVGWWLITPKIK